MMAASGISLFGPNRKVVVSSSSDGTVRFWDVMTGRAILKLMVSPGTPGIRSMSFSADGQILATAHVDLADPATLAGHVNFWLAPREGYQ